MVNINTKNILFICGGAFDGLAEIIENRTGKKAFGFNVDVTAQQKRSTTDLLELVEPEDLVEYGLIPELIGRLPVIIGLEELSEDQLLSILIEPKNSLIKQYKKLFELENVELKFTEKALQEVVKMTSKRKTGARGLRSILENVMLDDVQSAFHGKCSRVSGNRRCHQEKIGADLKAWEFPQVGLTHPAGFPAARNQGILLATVLPSPVHFPEFRRNSPGRSPWRRLRHHNLIKCIWSNNGKSK